MRRLPDFTITGPAGPRLPSCWPLLLLFAWFPLWWLAGISAFMWPIAAAPMLLALIWRGKTRTPAPLLVWVAFCLWVLISGVQLRGTRLMTFGYRFSLYAAAGILFLYVYNLRRSGRIDVKVLRILTIFWMIVVAGGFAGIVLGAATFVPPFEHILPHSLRSQPFVQELVQPVFAQIEGFLGSPIPRPSAPFTYTNNWGGNMAVLTAVAFAAAAAAGPGPRRRIIIGVVMASLVPMVVSLNRGMFLSLGVGLLYITIRLAGRGRVGALVSLLTLAAVAVAIVALTPLGHLVTGSFGSTHGHSNATRASLYQQAIAGANQSPLFGHGAPQPVSGAVLAGTPAIGTQGQLWMVLYSNGYPAIALLLLFFLFVLWQTRRVPTTAGLWLHTAVLIAVVQLPFYGWLPVELQVIMVVAALTYRRCRPDTPAVPAPVTAPPEGLAGPPDPTSPAPEAVAEPILAADPGPGPAADCGLGPAAPAPAP